MALPDKRLIWALGLSLALHVGLLFTPPPPEPEEHAPLVLEARLEKLAPPPPALPKAKPRPKPRPKPEARPAPQAGVPSPAVTGEPSPPELAVPVPPAEAPLEQPPVPEPVAVPAPTTLPARAELRYFLFKGDQGLNVGEVTQTWQRVGDAYTLISTAEATGLFSLFVSGKHEQVSRGKITATGLRPDFFSMQRGSAEKRDAARFDWEGGILHLDSEGRQSTAKLVTGALDLLSFTYQFAFFLPEAGDIRIDLTNGRKLDSYRYRIVAEEALATPMGTLKTVHLSKLHNPGEEGTEIWLGMDYHYLPVKIRQTDKKGESAEQVITEIRYE